MLILSRATNLEELDLSVSLGGPDGCFDRIIVGAAKLCPKLQSIVFGTSPCLDPGLVQTGCLSALGDACQLKHVRMALDHAKIHSHSSNLSVFFRACRNLETVHLENLCCLEYRFVFFWLLINLDRTVIRTLAMHNHKLKKLIIRMNADVVSYADLILLTLTKYTQGLEEFRFGPTPMFSDDAVTVLLEECTRLKILDLSGSPSLTNSIFKSVSAYGKSLEEIHISNSNRISLSGLIHLRGCDQLRFIYAENVVVDIDPDCMMPTFFEACPRLRWIAYTTRLGTPAVWYRR